MASPTYQEHLWASHTCCLDLGPPQWLFLPAQDLALGRYLLQVSRSGADLDEDTEWVQGRSIQNVKWDRCISIDTAVPPPDSSLMLETSRGVTSFLPHHHPFPEDQRQIRHRSSRVQGCKSQVHLTLVPGRQQNTTQKGIGKHSICFQQGLELQGKPGNLMQNDVQKTEQEVPTQKGKTQGWRKIRNNSVNVRLVFWHHFIPVFKIEITLSFND